MVKDLQPRSHQTVALLSVSLVARCHDCTLHEQIYDFLWREERKSGLVSVLSTSCLNEVRFCIARY